MQIIERHTAATTAVPERIGQPRVVELTDKELEVLDLSALIVEETGIPEPEAACLAVVVMPDPDPAFVSWLTDGVTEALDMVTAPGRG